MTEVPTRGSARRAFGFLQGTPERDDQSLVRRRGKEARERILAGAAAVLTAPLYLAVAISIKAEGLLDPSARGPVHVTETRVSRGRRIELLKFRTLKRDILEALPPGPTHIKLLEEDANLTRVGRVLKQWYLDEHPQLVNIVRGDMFLIGTRPYPVEYYEAELRRGITRKRDMPAGLVGPVQAAKGGEADGVALDDEYWEAFKDLSGWELLKLDVRILWQSLRTQLRHEGL